MYLSLTQLIKTTPKITFFLCPIMIFVAMDIYAQQVNSIGRTWNGSKPYTNVVPPRILFRNPYFAMIRTTSCCPQPQSHGKPQRTDILGSSICDRGCSGTMEDLSTLMTTSILSGVARIPKMLTISNGTIGSSRIGTP